MKTLRKVIWTEGLLLGQQHFQQWDRLNEESVNHRLRSLVPLGWGIAHLDYDPDALESGQLRIRAVQGLFQDGRTLAFNEADDGVLSCGLPSPAQEPVVVSIAMPANREAVGINGYASGSGRQGAWVVDYAEVPDEYDPSREREVALARANLSLLLDLQPGEPYAHMPVVRLIPKGDGAYRVDDTFVAPSMFLSAAPRLQVLAERMLELMSARSRALAELRPVRAPQGREGYGRDPVVAVVLSVLARTQMQLTHLLGQGRVHPERLFECLAHCCAEIQVHVASDPFWAPPPYRHGDPGPCFDALETRLRELIDAAMPAPRAQLTLERTSDAQYEARGIEEALGAGGHLYLAVRMDAGDPAWVTPFTRQAKVAAADQLEFLVSSALPGVPLTYDAHPPSTLAIKAGYEYFRLEPGGDSWKDVLEKRSLALFVPAPYRSAQFELVRVDD
ncbi:type VI secretion system-associated protein [Thioalkalivibrio denitrificans]|uniref:Type VI secretion system-associated protein n=1 Tax=Thioalkalivibrio denitrificans TaxID=108003 RepID=A0A1V3NEF4_9GAMM|nr:type VI secretion system baseplate subunit TssK [Thioalkalivibrio denitrificans]OOG23477.1 type VI secretion system-associated protein [Thioalkalivibrio denitrificans]